MKLSVVVPCYNEVANVSEFESELSKTLLKEKITYEIIFIDDGSTDDTYSKLSSLNKANKNVKVIRFSRNFGKEAAIYAGLKRCKGDFVVIMDADLQDPPSLLPEMYEAIVHEGYDSVATRRMNRKGEPLIRSFFAKLFYKIMNHISDSKIVDGARDYRMMTRQMVDAILSMCEYNRFSKGIFGWIGFRTKWIAYENVERVAGNTKWSFWELFKYSIEGMTAFSVKPLQIASIFGVLFSLIALLMIVFIVVRTWIFGDPTSGWPSLVCIIMLIGGIQLLCIGILGQYLSKTYLETKKRPIYIERESNVK